MPPFPTIQWMSSMPMYVLPPFCTAFSLPDSVFPNNYHRYTTLSVKFPLGKSQLTVLNPLNQRPKHVSTPETNKQGISRSLSASRPTPVTLGKVSIPSNGTYRPSCPDSSQKCPSPEVVITQHRPSCALAKGDRIFWYNQFTRT